MVSQFRLRINSSKLADFYNKSVFLREMISTVLFLVTMSCLVAGPKVEVMSVDSKMDSGILVTAKNFARAETDEIIRKIAYSIQKETVSG